MPVHFKGTSEYDNNYKWLDSFKSQSFSPEPEQIMDPAGKPSVKIYTSAEPPLQHKKRLGGPATSLSANYFSVPSSAPDFTLLGQQDKFADNVKYQHRQSGSEQKVYKNKENFGDASPPNKQLRMQKRIKPVIKSRHPPVRSPARQASTKSDPISPPPAPRDVANSVHLKETLKDKDLRDVLEKTPVVSSSVEAPIKSHTGKAVSGKGNTGAPAVAPEKPAREGKPEAQASPVEKTSMNESVQTNMKKGVTVSAPEALANYSLKYKAGVAPARPVWRSSEYQKQFQWVNGAKASPLIAADEIVHKSNTELGPYKTDGVPRFSEYNRQFQAPKAAASDLALYLNNNNNNNNNADAKVDDVNVQQTPEKSKAKRSKSAAAVRSSAPAGKVKPADDSVRKELKAKLMQTQGKIRRQGTEYRSNFKSPTRFTYERGTWHGAAAPQMIPRASDDANTNQNNNNSEDAPLANWFAEVIELRRRAAEYRQRAQGTHFSREHVLQLLNGPSSKSWDIASSDSAAGIKPSDNIKALDLQARPPAGKPSPLKRDPPADECSHEATEGDSPVMSEVDDQIRDDEEDMVTEEKDNKKSAVKGGKQRGADRKSRKMAWLEKDREALAAQARALEREGQRKQDEYYGDDDDNDVGGRLPTPELKSESPERARRHHLDLTTPAVGGAILSCPEPTKGNKIIVTSRSGDSYVTASDDFPTQPEHKKYNLEKLVTLPTLGRPSSDTHPLRDDNCESDRPMEMRYVVTPALIPGEEDKENAGIKAQGKRGRPKQVVGKLSAVQEDFSSTWAQPGLAEVQAKRLAQQADDDAISISVMSVASSASLASEVLERARKRQTFWDKNNTA